jgi:PBP1b-binding outer membrane lipoprotein LpoB
MHKASLLLCMFLLLAGCAARPAASPSSATSDEPPMPTGKGTKRALVLVDDKKPDPGAQPIDDQVSTRRIVEKVTAP